MKGWLGLGASVVLHASVVAVLWAFRVEPKQVEPLPAPKLATKVQLASPLPRRGEGQGEGREQPKKRPRARVVVAAAEPAAMPEEVGDPVEAVAEESTAAEPTAAPAPLTPALSPAGGEGAPPRRFDVSALHAALAEAARRCYPAAAKRFHLTGEAQVDFCLDATGALSSTKLASSTGQSLLDAAARECVIAGAMPMPAEASGGCYTVPVRFR